MNLLRTFGYGEKKLLNSNHTVTGKVTDVKRCWWLKVNTKPVHMGTMDGAVFPNIVHFTYEVGGVSYAGSRYVGLSPVYPRKGETLTVWYDEQNPARYAVNI